MAISTGVGTKFQVEGATTGTFVDLANVVSVTPPSVEVDDVEVESLDPEDGFKQYMPGLLDSKEVSLNINFDAQDTGHTALIADLNSRAIKQYKILLPDGASWTFSGFIKGFKPSEIQAGDIMQAEVTIRVTGKPTFAPGA